MNRYEYGGLLLLWGIWLLPFIFNRHRQGAAATRDNRARWGLLLQLAGYAILWLGQFWLRTPGWWQLLLSGLFFVLAVFLAWTATHALGRYLRFDAALRSDHELIQSGPYRFLRHPIYSSMLCMLLATGLLVASWPLLAAAGVVFLVGTEIRVRVEDGLLADRFGVKFHSYSKSASAYIPFVR